MKTCKLLREQVAAATGSKKAELVLKNAQIVNVFTQSVEIGDIAIEGGYIVGIGNYEGITEKDLGGAYVCPGFLDGHIHIESSMTSPGEFERAVVPHGTIAVITDPQCGRNGRDPVYDAVSAEAGSGCVFYAAFLCACYRFRRVRGRTSGKRSGAILRR